MVRIPSKTGKLEFATFFENQWRWSSNGIFVLGFQVSNYHCLVQLYVLHLGELFKSKCRWYTIHWSYEIFFGHSQFPLLAEQVALWRSLSGTELYVPRRMAWFFHLGDEVIQMSSMFLRTMCLWCPIIRRTYIYIYNLVYQIYICIGYISSCLWFQFIVCILLSGLQLVTC